MPQYGPLEQPSKALRIIVITGVCIAIAAVLIVAIDPFTPTLVVNPLSLNFTVDDGLDPIPQTVYIGSSHGAVDWSAVAGTPWLNLDPVDGRTGKETLMTLSVDIWGVYRGDYAASVTISASDAENSPIEIPVNLVVTDTQETLSIKKAVGGEMGNLQVYYDEQPLYGGINLVNSQSAMNPTWEQLLRFVESDITDEQTYVEGEYMCGDFAETLHNNAEKEGIRAAWVAVDFADSTIGHALNAFNTVDQGIVFVDCTGGGFEVFTPSLGDGQSYETDYDTIAYVKIGEEYGLVNIELARSPQYAFYEQYEEQWEEYESRVEEYNASVEEYNKKVKEYNREISRGTYEYGRMMMIRLDLEREEEELKEEEQKLNRLLADLGYGRWESLGVVSRVEIYW